MRTFIIVFVCFASLTFACKKASVSQTNIVGGQDVDHTSFVRLSTVALAHADNTSTYSCTGSIVSQDLILTAAHCVEKFVENNELAKLRVVFEVKGGRILLAATAIEMFNPKGSLYYPQQDIAWIRLERPVPETFAPVPILRDLSQLPAGTSIMIAGYGRTKTDCNDKNCRSSLKQAPTQFKAYYDEAHLSSLFVAAGVTDKLGGTCYGDSGGPAFVQLNGTWYLIGVLAGTSPTLTPESVVNGKVSCEAKHSVFTAAGDYVEWLDSSAKVSVIKDVGDIQRRPLIQTASTAQLPEKKDQYQQWLNFAGINHPAWITVEAMQNFALRKIGKAGIQYYQDAASIDELAKTIISFGFTDLDILTQDRLRKMMSFKDFQPFMAFPNLRRLNVKVEKGANLDGLQNLSQLESLTLTMEPGASAGDINMEALQSMAALKELSLIDIPMSNLADLDLTQLTKLSTLQLTGSALVVPKLPATGLVSLQISGRILRFAERLAELPSTLERIVIQSPELKTLPNLEPLTNLRSLDLSLSGIVDFTGISKAPALKSLVAIGNPAAQRVCPTAPLTCTYDRIENPTNLMEYCINYVNKVSGSENYAPIFSGGNSGPTNTQTGNDFGSSFCASFKSKSEVQNSLTVLATLTPGALQTQVLTQFPKLEVLTIKNGALESLKFLETLPDLRQVSLDGSRLLTQVQGLSFPKIETLSIKFPMASELPAMEMPKLKRLMLENLKANDLEFVSQYPGLEELRLYNPAGISDWKKLGTMVGLKRIELVQISLTDFNLFSRFIGSDVTLQSLTRFENTETCPIMLGSCEYKDVSSGTVKRGPPLGMLTGQEIPRAMPQLQQLGAKTIDLPGF